MWIGLRSQERFIFGTYVIAILALSYVIDRSDFAQVILAYSVAFYGFYHWIHKRRFTSIKRIAGQAIFVRLLMVFALPLLSDDYFRFIWDGLVQLQGQSPFGVLPSAYEGGSVFMEQSLLSQMNSPDYFSIYPPVLQWIWQGTSLIVGESVIKQVIAMRILIILADIGVIYVGASILRAMGRSARATALYALNPLVIVELTGNLHYEGLMIFLVLLGIRLLMYWRLEIKSAWALCAGSLAIALGVLTKVVLLLAIPAMWRRWGAGKTLLIALLSSGFIFLGFRYFIDLALFQNMATSYDLYFRNFEFNASIYNLSMHIASHWVPDYTAQVVGPWVSLVMILLIALLALFRKADNWEQYFVTLLLILTTHLLFSSTVHPWYVVNLVAISMFTNYRYAILWSYLAVYSYHMYALDFHEVWWVVALQYVLMLSYMFWEWSKERPFFRLRVGGGPV